MKWKWESQWKNRVKFTEGSSGSIVNRNNFVYKMIWNLIIQHKMYDETTDIVT